MEGGDVKPPPLTSPWSRVRDADPSHNAAILMNVDAPVAIGDYSDRIFPASHRCCQLSNAGTERGHAHQRRGNNVISPFAIVDLIGLHLKHRAAQALCFCIAVTHYLVFFCPPSLLLLLVQNKWSNIQHFLVFRLQQAQCTSSCWCLRPCDLAVPPPPAR